MSEATPIEAPAEGAIRHAENLIALRRYADALPWIGRAIAADPDGARPHCLLTVALLHLRQYRRALKAAEIAVLRDPENEWPHRLRSVCLLRLGKRREALNAAREAVRLGPDVPEALYTLLVAQLGCNQKLPASATAERLSGIAPDNVFAHKALGFMAYASRQWNAAEAHFRRALAIDPLDIEALNALGFALQLQGKHLEALERQFDAARLEPTADSVKAHLQNALGWYLRPTVLLIILGALTWTWGRLDATRSPFAPVALFAIAALATAWILWRRARIRTLPEHLALLLRHERVWAPLPTGSDRVIVLAVVLAVATLGAALVSIAIQLAARDWTGLFVLAPFVVLYVALIVIVLMWAGGRLRRRFTG